MGGIILLICFITFCVAILIYVWYDMSKSIKEYNQKQIEEKKINRKNRRINYYR